VEKKLDEAHGEYATLSLQKERAEVQKTQIELSEGEVLEKEK